MSLRTATSTLACAVLHFPRVFSVTYAVCDLPSVNVRHLPPVFSRDAHTHCPRVMSQRTVCLTWPRYSIFSGYCPFCIRIQVFFCSLQSEVTSSILSVKSVTTDLRLTSVLYDFEFLRRAPGHRGYDTWYSKKFRVADNIHELRS